jgi:hypothetical protein
LIKHRDNIYFRLYMHLKWGLESSVIISTRLRAGRPGFDCRYGLVIFAFLNTSRPFLGPASPPVQWVQGAISMEVKRPEREANHTLPSNVEVKNAWSYTSTRLWISLHSAITMPKDQESESTGTFRLLIILPILKFNVVMIRSAADWR